MLRKNDIISNLIKDLVISKSLATDIYLNIVEQIKNELRKGSDVVLTKLFTLSVKKSEGRTIVAPRGGKVCTYDSYKKLCCKYAKSFKDEIKKN